MDTFRIRSISKFLPGKPISHSQVEELAGIRKGWVEKNSGVSTRYFASKTDSIASMTAKSLSCCLNKQGLGLADLDLLICAGATYDYPIPYNACMVKKEMEAYNVPLHCFDVDATCLSFLVGMDVALSFMETKNLRRVAVTSAEIASRSLNPSDPKTYSLFGDAAVAMILDQEEGKQVQVLGSHFENYCEGAEFAMVPAGGNALLGFDPEANRKDFYFQMKGKKLLKMTFAKVDKFLGNLERQTGIPLQHYDYIIPHQASKFGNDLFIKKYKLDKQKVYQGLESYGNCISTSVALGLEQAMNGNFLQKGAKVLLVGTAAGLSFGGIALSF